MEAQAKYKPDGVTRRRYRKQQLANALTKAIPTLADMSIRRIAVPWDYGKQVAKPDW